MFLGCLQDFSRMFSGCSDGSYWPGGIWWSFQMKVWTLKIQRNPMIPNYSMIPAAAIRWSPGIRWSPSIRWSIRSMDFDNRKVYSDTSITDGLVLYKELRSSFFQSLSVSEWVSEGSVTFDQITESAQTEYCPTFNCPSVCQWAGVTSQLVSIIWWFRWLTFQSRSRQPFSIKASCFAEEWQINATFPVTVTCTLPQNI